MLKRVEAGAAVLMAFEQVGGTEAALNMAKEYSLDRYAFGRQIGSYQAIKHKPRRYVCEAWNWRAPMPITAR